jgi:hypothetical protein
MRAIDIRLGEEIDEEAFKALISAAVAQNISSLARRVDRPASARSGAGTR